MSTPKNPVNAVQVSLDILEALQQRRAAGVTELANAVGVTKGTAHNHLSTLEYNDYVTKDDEGRYLLGFRFLELAHHAKRRVGIYDLVTEQVDLLAEETEEMTLYTVEEHGLGVCLYRALGENAVQTLLHVGYRSPLHRTAVGKAILAYQPDERLEAIIETRGLERATENTITDPATLRAELETVRERGFAVNEEETIRGLVGVGVPIVVQDEMIAGAISVIGPRSRMDDDRLYEVIPDSIARSVNVIQVNATSIEVS